MKHSLYLIGCLVLAALAGCQSLGPRFDAYQPESGGASTATNLFTATTTNQIRSEWLRPTTNAFTLGPGDRLDVELIGDATTRTTTIVGPDGKIYFYLLPGVKVSGLTLIEAKNLMEKELTKFIRGEPKIALSLRTVESKRVWLLGRIRTPGVYTLSTPLTLLEAISLAGGPSPLGPAASLSGSAITVNLASSTQESADLRRSFIIRQGKMLPVDFQRLLRGGDMTQNVYLQPDDFVYVAPKVAENVYVLGAVAQPKAVQFAEQMGIVSALSYAGGAITNAYLTHVAIVRGSLAEPRVAIVDYKAILHGKAADVMLEQNDIVYVPFTPYQTIARYVDLILNTFVRTVSANEGARAVSRGAVPVGVNVPLGF